MRLVFDKHGNKRGHTFLRAMMRSAAKLAYEEAQAAIDGEPSAKCKPLHARARSSRCGPPIAARGRTRATAASRSTSTCPSARSCSTPRAVSSAWLAPERLEAHRLIEEFMIQANVAAAEALEAKRAPVVYRVHDAPSKEKLAALREFLESLELKLPGAGALKAGDFNRVLQRAKALPVADLVNEIVLRSQSQAVYAADNLGHFGLQPAPLCAFHLADPPLRRPRRAPLADPRAGARRRRPR